MQFAASDEPTNRLLADIQPTSDRGDIEQRRDGRDQRVAAATG
jgi:hypothetical protein